MQFFNCAATFGVVEPMRRRFFHWRWHAVLIYEKGLAIATKKGLSLCAAAPCMGITPPVKHLIEKYSRKVSRANPQAFQNYSKSFPGGVLSEYFWIRFGFAWSILVLRVSSVLEASHSCAQHVCICTSMETAPQAVRKNGSSECTV